MPIRVPPGRMGRLWLRERLAVAERATEVLEEKRGALRDEARLLRHLAAETLERWQAACRDAQAWQLRAAVMGGERQFRLAAARESEASEARVVWRSLMGLAYPAEAECILGPRVRIGGLAETSALHVAADMSRAALIAGVEHAAAQRALDLVTADLAITTRRLRAIERRWIPMIETALHETEGRLDERERETAVRARWALDRTGRQEAS